MALRSRVGLCLALLWPAQAIADDAKPPLTVRRPRAAKPPPPSTPPASATLHVTPGALGTSWTFELTNADTTPLRLVADGRLLTLDVTPEDDGEGTHAKKPHVVRCSLPAEVRPTTDAERARVLVPGSTYVEEFDPRLYCFDGRDAAALVPGSHVVAHLGWSTRGGPHAPPFVADELFGGEERAGVKELTAESVVTPDAFPEDDEDERPHKLRVTAPSHIDAEIGRDLTVDVTVENATSRPLRLMLRPETLAFEVASPKGVYQCTWRTHPGAPIAEVFTEVTPHAKASTNVLLATMCPDATFREAGLYTVFPRIDTRRASGKAIGIDTFDGVVAATAPILVRIRQTHAPLRRGPMRSEEMVVDSHPGE